MSRKYRDISRRATREQKREAKDQFKFLISLGNGRKRSMDDKLSSYFALLNNIVRGKW